MTMKEKSQPKLMRTLHFKVRPQHYRTLNIGAREVNTIWNICRMNQDVPIIENGKHVIKFGPKVKKSKNGLLQQVKDKQGNPIIVCLNKWRVAKGKGTNAITSVLAGASKYIHPVTHEVMNTIVSQASLCEVGAEYTKRRCGDEVHPAKPNGLKPRIDEGSHRSLGWIPLRAQEIKVNGNSIVYHGRTWRLFEGNRLREYGEHLNGNFAQDALGDWYFNLVVPVPVSTAVPRTGKIVGVDLGLKSAATLSDGAKFSAPRVNAKFAAKQAKLQRHKHIKQAKRISRKMKRVRKDHLDKISRKIVDRYDGIVVGNLSVKKLMRRNRNGPKMGKSFADAALGELKRQLVYKSNYAGKSCVTPNESYTTVVCSSCGSPSGPTGPRGLSVRAWVCHDCGAHHDRDVNAARNILTLGRGQLNICRSKPSGDMLSTTDPCSCASVSGNHTLQTAVLENEATKPVMAGAIQATATRAA